MKLLFIISIFSNPFIFAEKAQRSLPLFSDTQMQMFYDKTVKVNCSVPAPDKIKIVQKHEKCLVIDAESDTTPKALVIKLSCKEDEIINTLMNEAIEKCNVQTLEEQKKVAEEKKRLEEEKKKFEDQKKNNPPSGGSAGSSGGGGATGSGGSGGSGCAVFGPSTECPKPKETTYSWCRPNPTPVGTVCYFDSSYSQPDKSTAPCGKSNSGDSIAYGETILSCVASNASQEELNALFKKNKDVDKKTLAQVVPKPKRMYGWFVIKSEPVPNCVYDSFQDSECGKESLGKVKSQCGITQKCARLDGAPGLSRADRKGVAFSKEDDEKYDAQVEADYEAAVNANKNPYTHQEQAK